MVLTWSTRASTQPPVDAARDRKETTDGMSRCVKNTTDATPLSAAAAETASASAGSRATGLSRKRCGPAGAADNAIVACTGGGRAIATASTSPISASTVSYAAILY